MSAAQVSTDDETSARTRPETSPSATADDGARDFDGIICFGGVDWWYHNRGHYDLQMMRELSAHMPVLYVNSLGVRTPKPSEGRVFLKRAARKLRSIGRGFRRVRPGFGVLSPPTVPFLKKNAAVQALTVRAVLRSARAMGMEKPLVWVNCPSAAELLDRMPDGPLVYQRTDRFEEFPGSDTEQMLGYHRRLARADLTLYCTRSLYEEERADCRNAVFVDHGVDFSRFAGADGAADPPDVAHIPRPRVGFVGGIDAHTFDPDLFVEVARRMPDVSFVLVGGCSLPEDWCTEPNVHLMGRRDYESVPEYMAAADVLIMPWRQNEWIKACNPIKLKEYLAIGRPIVSTPFDELARYPGVVEAALGPDDFSGAIRRALEATHDASPQRLRVERETWHVKAQEVLSHLEAIEAEVGR